MRIIICGIGGQGIITLNNTLAYLASNLGHKVISAETHGMAMRGGSVYTFLKIDEGYSAAIEREGADLILSTNLIETHRNIKYLKKNGIIITEGNYKTDLPYIIEGDDYIKISTEKFGSPMYASSIMIGILIKLFPKLFTFKQSTEILKNKDKINLSAMEYGYEKTHGK